MAPFNDFEVSTVKQLKQNMKHAINALASANAGEMLGRRAKQRHFIAQGTTQAQPQATPETTMTPKRKQVALWLQEMPSKAVLSYALSTCQRMDMDLVIIHSGNLRAQSLLASHGEAMEATDVMIDIQALDNAEEATLFNYVKRNSRIAFLVLGSADSLMKPQGSAGKRPIAMPPVPIVVVTSSESEAVPAAPRHAIAA